MLSLDYDDFSFDPPNPTPSDLLGEGDGDAGGDGVLLLAAGLVFVLFIGELLFLLLGGAAFFLFVSGGLAGLI